MNFRKMMATAAVIALGAAPISTFAKTHVHAENGGSSGYGSVDKTTEDNGDVDISCSGPGVTSCPGLASIKAADQPYFTHAWNQIFVVGNLVGSYSDAGGHVTWTAGISITGMMNYDIKVNY